MTNEKIKQALNLIQEAKTILLCLPSHANVDDIASGLALKEILLSLNKEEVILVGDSIKINKRLLFLDGVDEIENQLPPLSSLTISIDTRNILIDDIEQTKDEDKIEINIQPRHGYLNAENVTLKNTPYVFDMIITLGAINFHSLGEMFVKTPDFFYLTPVINIDHQVSNENFGEVNVTDFTKSSVCEVVFDLMEAYFEDNPSKNVASKILGGIIYQTKGLRTQRITPQTLENVSRLIELGADITEINTQLFHNKDLNTLKLWGRVLARLKEDEKYNLVWSLIPYDDFLKTRTSETNVPNIVTELIGAGQLSKSVFLLWQNNKQTISGILNVKAPHNALLVLEKFNPTGRHNLANFEVKTNSLLEAEKEVLETIRPQLIK